MPAPELINQSVPLPEEKIGWVIGKGGSYVQQLAIKSGATLRVSDSSSYEYGRTWKYVQISGPPRAVDRAKKLLHIRLERLSDRGGEAGGLQDNGLDSVPMPPVPGAPAPLSCPRTEFSPEGHLLTSECTTASNDGSSSGTGPGGSESTSPSTAQEHHLAAQQLITDGILAAAASSAASLSQQHHAAAAAAPLST